MSKKIYKPTVTKPEIRRLSGGCVEIARKVTGAPDILSLYIADIHLDNPKCKKDLLRKHLDQCMERDALVFVFGDLFCAMQGKGDPRGEKGDLPKEYYEMLAKQESDATTQQKKLVYINFLVDYAFEFFKPYASNLAVFSNGNHETSFMKHREYDLLAGLCQRLQLEANSPVQHMGYQGWIKHRYITPSGSRSKGGCGNALLTHFDHGRGGGGPVTRNVIETNRRLARVQGADIYVYGHVHESWMVKTRQHSVTSQGRPKIKEQIHLQCATYKEEYNEEGEGFHMERGGAPKPLGGWWVRHKLHVNQGDRQWRVTAEETY